MWQDTIKLGFYNSLVMGNVPSKVELDRVAEKVKKDLVSGRQFDIGSFGLFDSSQPNYTTYYPDVTADDLVPKDSDFIEPTFRALSEVIVHKSWNPVDFSTKGVLKNSMGLLRGATVNPDHEAGSVGNAIGAVKNTAWEESYKADHGIIVPAGILALMRLDGKSNPRIARGIQMDPPSIHSSSVTVQFMWDKSHPNLSDEEFFNKLGTFDKDGKMIRRMTTKIIKYPELSLVSHGADPYAMKVGKNGQIVNPVYADTSYNSASLKDRVEMRKNEKYFIFDFKTDLIQNEEENTIPSQSNDNLNLSDMNEFLIKLAAALGITGATTEEAVLAAITARTGSVNTLQASVDSLTTAQTTNLAEITRLKLIETELTQLKANNPTAAETARLTAFETSVLTANRTRVTLIYNKIKDNKPDAAITAMLASANLEVLAGLETEYTAQLEAKFPPKCGKCGSTTITRASAILGATETPIIKDNANTMEALRETKRKSDSIPLNGVSAKK